MKFSLLHPSRQRPIKSFHTIQTWLFRAGEHTDVELIVSIDNDDPQKERYKELYAGLKVISNDNRSAIDAINRAAEIATGDVLIVVSDDFDCPRNWAITLDRILRGRQDYLLKVNDGTQQYIVTIPIMDRVYYKRFGYIYPPQYKHMFCDTHITHLADILKCLYVRNDILFKHNHYSVLHEPKDDVAKRADNTWHEGKKVYLDFVMRRFGLPEDVDVMELRDPEGQLHKLWLKANI